MEQHPDVTVQADPSIVPAIQELYKFLCGTYLPLRYPTLFQLLGGSSSSGQLYNQATETTLPLSPPENPIEALNILGRNMYEKSRSSKVKDITRSFRIKPSGWELLGFDSNTPEMSLLQLIPKEELLFR